MRIHAPNGRIVFQGEVRPGDVALQPAIASHSFENTDTKECKILIVERK